MASSFSVWVALNISAPTVRDYGIYTVRKHNSDTRDDLKFESILQAHFQESEYRTFRIRLTAKKGNIVKTCEALMNDIADAKRRVFRLLKVSLEDALKLQIVPSITIVLPHRLNSVIPHGGSTDVKGNPYGKGGSHGGERNEEKGQENKAVEKDMGIQQT
ncbi:unnamed protein product [Lupinus luteus]|uniref:Uncharacterized protein n=1 Tax=Lupinus luteus TaxID=3873 RepID=A0AAV1YDT9_LUPLU